MRDKIIGIFGMGGSGKTTLVKYLFNSKHSEFSGSTILFDVRENHVKGALTALQSKLLNDLFPGNHHSFCSIEEGTANIKHNLQGSQESRFLIVIDDVDHQKQLDALLPIDALNRNSLVIVTTRDERLLIKVGVTVRFKMKEMNAEHSRELFCWHAFNRECCRSGFEDLVDSFVKACGGLPLALQVMGGHVFGSGRPYWKLQLDAVKTKLDKDIKDTLKISYDALEEDQKQIFMDIACFFIGEDVSRAISIWKASGWRAEHALQTLKDKCLVEVQFCYGGDINRCHYEPEFVLKMHELLRDLGREMADKETSQPTDNEMSHPHRLWRPEDLIGMRKIKGFQDTLAVPEGKSFRCYSYLDMNFDMRYFLGSSKKSTDLQWLELRSDLFIPEWIPQQNLHTLILERVSPARLCQRDDQVLVKLKELACSFTYIADSNLQDMYMSDLYKLLSSFGRFKNLESLCIDFGINSLSWNIEWNCLLKSVRELTNLQTLRLKNFFAEGEISLSDMGMRTDDRFPMRSLEAIILCEASNTTKVSISGQFCPSLKSLKLCSMRDLIDVDLTGVTTLECLKLFKCRQLRKVLGNDLLKLEIFHIKLCWTMRELPNFGCASYLRKIYISRCRNLEDISAAATLKGLKRIWIAYCPELKNIKAIEQLKGLNRIWLQSCTQLEGVICFKELKDLRKIFIVKCARLQNIQGIEFLIRLEKIFIIECPKLKSISGVEEMEGLKDIIISDSPVISCIERLQRLPSELTILVGRSAMQFDPRSSMSYFGADEIGDTLSIVDAFCEIDWKGNSEDVYVWERRNQVEDMIQSFQKTHHSLTTFIFCALVRDSPQIGGDIFNGTRILIEYKYGAKYINLFRRGTDWIYTSVLNEEKLSKYESWMPHSDGIEKAFLMGVNAGEDRKTLHILESLFSRLCVQFSDDGCKESERESEFEFDEFRVFSYDMPEYIVDDDDDDYNGGEDGDHYNDNVREF